jgi:outer membrane protein assembly factor BamB
VKWKTRLTGSVTGPTPVIANDGTIYIGTSGWKSKFQAINPNGTEKWEFDVGDFIDGSPAIGADGTIYVATDSVNSNAHFFAINPNGTEKWVMPFGAGIYSSPVIAQDGTIFIGAHQKMCAINPNGTILWSYTTGDAIAASPAIGSDGTVYVASQDGYFYSFYPSNGTVKWKLQIAGGISCYSSPAIDKNGIIYYGTRDNFYAINPNGTVKWWAYGGCYVGGPVIADDGTVYACGNDFLYAWHPNGTGWDIWMGAYDASPVIRKDGMIYAIQGRGADLGSDIVCLISPAGSIVSSVKLEAQFLISDLSIGQDGTVYLGSWTGFDGGYLYAIGTIYNEPPSLPTISGPTKGDVGENYTFNMQTTDPDGNQIYYYVDWGDNTNSGWIGPFDSGTNVSMNHTWYNGGNFTIRVITKDVYDDESGWSAPWVLHLSGPNIVISARGGFGIHMIIKNIGDKPANNVSCFMNYTMFPPVKLRFPKKSHFEKIEPVIEAGSTKIVWVFTYGFGVIEWTMTMKTEKFSEVISKMCLVVGPFDFVSKHS